MAYYLGIDLHKTQFTVSVFGSSEPIVQYPTTSEGYAGLKNRISGWIHNGSEVHVGVESTGNTRFFKYQMEEAGAKVTVINTLRFKVINQSTKKTDKHDAAKIAEFLAINMLPEAHLCSRESENLRRLLKVRRELIVSSVRIKNEIHSILTSLGIKDKNLFSKKGRQFVLAFLTSQGDKKLETMSVGNMCDIIDTLQKKIRDIENQCDALTKNDIVVRRLLTLPGCGIITAWTIRAYTDDISRFESAKKYAAYCGLVPWVQSSNEKTYIGRITKHGPQELRTAYVQFVMALLRSKKTQNWRVVKRYKIIKEKASSGKSIIATARKLAEIVWTILTQEKDFDESFMTEE